MVKVKKKSVASDEGLSQSLGAFDDKDTWTSAERLWLLCRTNNNADKSRSSGKKKVFSLNSSEESTEEEPLGLESQQLSDI